MFVSTKSSRIITTTVFVNFNSCKKSPYSSYTRPSYVIDTELRTTVDEHDVEKFSQLNETWWDPSGPMKGLHAFNKIRVPFFRDALVQNAQSVNSKAPLENLKLLDLGCGGGILSEELAKMGAEVTGIDATKEIIEVAKQHSLSNIDLIKKPRYECTTIEDYVHVKRNYFDCVIASEVVEHVNNPDLFVKSSIEVLKPGGTIFYTTPNRTLLSKINMIWIAEYMLRAIPIGTHEHHKFFRPSELAAMLEKNNCKVELLRGIKYSPLTNKSAFINTLSFMYAVQAKKMK